MNDMIQEKTWDEFRGTGLLLFVNIFLHIFGWAIVVEVADDKVMTTYPARVKFRGFGEDDQGEAHRKIAEYLKNNITDLVKQAK